MSSREEGSYRNREDRVREFNEAAGKKTSTQGGDPMLEVVCFAEELVEFNEAIAEYISNKSEDNRKALVKEWADVQVTLSNLAWFFGIDGEEAFTRVADNNMTKVVGGKVFFRSDGKVLKPDNYVKPDMGGL